jgi:hypothetical protein
MNAQGDLLDLAAAIAARDEAVNRVGANADPDWVAHALHAVWCLATTTDEITTDDVWDALGSTTGTHEPRALGSVMKRAAALGYVKPTDRYRPSARAACHARPVKVWASLIRPGAA